VILTSSHFGYPLSSTHAISGGVMGTGAAKRLSAVRWGVAGNIAAAWVLTLPAAGLFGAIVYWIQQDLGAGVTGPIVVWAVALAALTLLMLTRVTRVARAAEA
jgi:PiT family inorganic phosphate transporter